VLSWVVLDPFRLAFQHAGPHGVLVAFHIPDSADPVPAEVLERLHPAEAELAREHRGYRQGQFVGGRLALRRACEQLGEQPPPILSTERGAPVVGERLVGSVSHKRDLAVGMAARPIDGTLGVDVEDYLPMRLSIQDSILRPEEIERIADLPEQRRWIALLLTFSLKECVYKALDPFVNRYIGFHEASVDLDLQGRADITLHLANGEGPFDLDARFAWLHGRVLSSVRARRRETGT
jgi:enterobactin synthetase component D